MRPTVDAGHPLYPQVEPYRTDWLDAGGAHRVYFEECGSPAGFPALFVHGGPGSRVRPAHRRFFDPRFYRVVLFDQRGCGRSTPAGETRDNTTAHLVADMEQLRRQLGVDRWLLFGGSWGATLCLAYAVAHPDRVAGMVLRGVFLASDAEVHWYVSGLRRFVPEAWGEFARGAGDSIVLHYLARVADPDPEQALAAARRGCDYESLVTALGEPAGGSEAAPAQELLARARVQLHFLAHGCFLRPNELLDNLWRIGPAPAIVVQGRLDMVCPPATALEVAGRLPGAELRLVADGGHTALQPAIAKELCAATARMRDRLTKSG
jgi:proline iminopeptidase